MLVNIVRWRVPKENSGKLLEFMRWWMGWQRVHPDRMHYIRSRLLTMTEEGSSEEHWVYLDEYERREDFDKQRMTIREDPELSRVVKDECYPKFDALIVSGSRKSEVWTELEELRVEFKEP